MVSLRIAGFRFVMISLALIVRIVSTLYNGAMARLTLTFFGTFQVALDSQPITRFRSSKNAGLLVYLALQSDRPFPREVLATLFWPEESDNDARNNLRQAVYQLRKVLGDLENPDAPYLLATRQSVQFNADSEFTLDVNHFWQSIDRGDLETAVAIYHGDLLPGFICDSLPFEDWLRQERERLHQKALEAMSVVTRGHLQAGRLDKAQAVARQQLSLEPWRESACRQLMQAYALAGERGSALAQYEQCREVLWEELGVEPAAETTALYESIKEGKVGPVTAEESLEAPRAVRHNLPVYASTIVGREAELRALDAAMADPAVRLVTIMGPGGIGKTRLAVAAAGRILDARLFADGVFYIDLTRLRETNRILPALVDALDLPFAGEDDRSARRKFLHYLSQKKMLLVMDNFEHLLDGAELVADVLQAAPAVNVLVTSRERLKIRLEQVYPIDGLAFPELETTGDANELAAGRFFLEAAERSRPDFALRGDQDLTHLARLCRLVEGMPLALELAASWVDVLALDEIASELQHGLGILETELRDVPERQRSVKACFAYTWRRLDQAEQRIFAQLSIFRDGFTRAAVQEVTGASLRQLSNLVNKSLIRFDTGRKRYEIHELLRQFGAEKLGGQPELEASTSEHHSNYYLQFLAGYTDALKGKGQRQALSAIRADLDNVQLAWDHACAQENYEAIGWSLESLWRFHWVGGGGGVIGEFEKAVASLSKGEATGERGIVLGRLLAPLGHSYRMREQRAKAREILTESLDLLQRLGATDESLLPLLLLAEVQESMEESNRLYIEGLALARAVGDPWAIAHVLLQKVLNGLFTGEYQEAEPFGHEALEQFRRNEDEMGMAAALRTLSFLAIDRGQYKEAVRLARESLVLTRGVNEMVRVMGMHALSFALIALEEYEKAEALIRQVRAESREYGREWQGVPLVLGAIAYARKEYARAERLYQESLERFSATRENYFIIGCQLALGRVKVAQGKEHEARKHLRVALRTAIQLGWRSFLPDCLMGMAELFAEEGDFSNAAHLAILVVADSASRAMTRERGERLLTQIERELSSDQMSTIRQRGRTSDLGTVAAQLLSELETP